MHLGVAPFVNQQREPFMNPFKILCLSFVSLISLSASVKEAQLINQSWAFQYFGDLNETDELQVKNKVIQKSFDDSSWRDLNLPHDWAIEMDFDKNLPNRTGKLPWQGLGVYRKKLQVSTKVNKRYFIHFDGAMSHAEVWLNGKSVGHWPYGYNAFQFEITDILNLNADNDLCVILKNPPNSSRWYPGAGIYRNVWLIEKDEVAITHDGIFVYAKNCDEEQSEIVIESELENTKTEALELTLVQKIKSAGNLIKELKPRSLSLNPGETKLVKQEALLKEAKLWSVENPHLYELESLLYHEGNLVDRVSNNFGLRSIEFNAQKGFLLNGEKVKLKGVCLHHDLGALGAAVNRTALERRFKLLKEMGCNAVRTAHNPMCPDFMDLCDRMGFLVVNELFDGWARSKTENDYGKHFYDWYKKDVANFVRRDRNHPSVIMWSSGNEVRDGYFGKEKLYENSRLLAEEFKFHDPTRPVTVGCDNIWFGFGGFQKTVDIFGYNYKPHKYAEFHERNPNIPIMGSETASTVSSRGEYFFPVVDDKNQGYNPKTFQMSSYDLYAPEWASAPDVEFEAQDKYDFVLGEFVWTGFDYLGEPTPFNNDPSILSNLKDPKAKKKLEEKMKRMGGAAPSRSSYFGIMDLCGFKKDRFYLYQAKWRPKLPIAHILPHWNWSERIGQVTPVHVYSSGDEAELFLNGKSQGVRKKEKYQYRFRWDDVIYEPGELRVVVKKQGEFWAENKKKSSTLAHRIKLSAEQTNPRVDDLIFVNAELKDIEGVTVPRDSREVRFKVEGPAEIIATGNGDPTSLESYRKHNRKFFNGFCQVIIRATGKGKIQVLAESSKLASGDVTVKTD